ncbi:MAG: hypothetical protein Q9187_000299 [Circinaria calcarea]
MLDPAIVRALSLDPSSSGIAPRSGSAFSTTAKITTTSGDGSEKHYFLKMGPGTDAAIMFEGEYLSLNAIHAVVSSLCPRAYAFGKMEEPPERFFLVTDYFDLSARAPTGKGSGLSLAAKLAKLHTTPAPIPEGYSSPVFGFPVTTCCGDSAQPNDYRESWAEFYAENRLLAILKKSERTNGKDAELRSMVERTARTVVPKLLGDEILDCGKGITPVVIHGDLWSGNKGKGKIGSSQDVEDVVFDPSSSYSHSECELGIMKMFGGFGGSFLQEYHALCPKSEPVAEYEDRVGLYEL